MSDEFFSKSYGSRDYITVLYRTFFNREPEESGMEYYLDRIAERLNRRAVLTGFVNSPEFDALCTGYGISRGELVVEKPTISEGIYDYVNRCYSYFLGREGDEARIEYWVQRIVEKNCAPKEVAKAFFLSQEYVSKNTSDTDYIKALYKTFMDCEAEAEDLNYWLEILAGGAIRGEALDAFASSPEFKQIMESYGL